MADQDMTEEEIIRDWRDLCETTILAISALVTSSGRAVSTTTIIETLRQMPKGLETEQKIERDCFLGRCLVKAKEDGTWARRGEKEFMTAVMRVARMEKDDRAMLEACVAGVLLGFVASKQ